MLEDRIIVQDRGIDAGLAALMQNANKGMDPAALMAMMNNGGFGGTKPTTVVLVGLNSEKATVLQHLILFIQGIFGKLPKIIGSG